MRHPMRWLALGLLSLSTAAMLQAADGKKGPEPATCNTFGTSVQFEKSPSEAARRAEKEEKLVLVLHISGLFEDPDFT
jgi:hypothetical protein